MHIFVVTCAIRSWCDYNVNVLYYNPLYKHVIITTHTYIYIFFLFILYISLLYYSLLFIERLLVFYDMLFFNNIF